VVQNKFSYEDKRNKRQYLFENIFEIMCCEIRTVYAARGAGGLDVPQCGSGATAKLC